MARRTQVERTELSDQLMLDAAMALILDIGTQATTLKEIGVNAGFSRGLAHSRFGSKDALFIRLSDRCRTRWLETLQTAQEGKIGLDILLSRLDAIIDFAESRPEDAKTMYILWFEAVGTPSEINESLARFHRQAREDIKTLVQESGLISGDNSKRLAERYAAQFCGTIFGLCYQWLVCEESIDLKANLDDLRNKLLTEYEKVTER